MKYVVLRVGGKQPIEIPVVFPNLLVHAHVAERLQPLLQEMFKQEVTAVSAGEVSLFEVEGCGGKSTTLDLVSRGEDDDYLLRMSDYGAGLCAE